MPPDNPDSPVGKRDDSLTIILGQCKYVNIAKSLDLPPDPDNLLGKIEVFNGDAEQLPFPHAA